MIIACVCVCVFVRACVRVFVCACVCVYVGTYVRARVCSSLWVSICFTRTHACTHARGDIAGFTKTDQHKALQTHQVRLSRERSCLTACPWAFVEPVVVHSIDYPCDRGRCSAFPLDSRRSSHTARGLSHGRRNPERHSSALLYKGHVSQMSTR